MRSIAAGLDTEHNLYQCKDTPHPGAFCCYTNGAWFFKG